MSFIPYSKQFIDSEDIEEVVNVLKSDWLTQGPKPREFEENFCKFTGAKYSISVSNGTAALHLACLVLNISPGDEVITTANTFLASANAIRYVGATPILVDINPETLNLDIDVVKKAITKKTKAIIPVHFAGISCDMQALSKLAQEHNIKLIEDGCHSLGGSYNDCPVGACKYSDFTTFSFHPVKAIATGEGGMITTNNKAFYEKLLMLRTHGVTKDPEKISKNEGPWYYEMQHLGYNYRLTDIQASLGITQLKKLPNFIKRRNEIAVQYKKAFNNISWIKLIKEEKNIKCAYHLFVIQINFKKIKKTRTEVMTYLRENQIGTQVHYIPIYHQPAYKKYKYSKKSFPNMENYYEQALSIPIYQSMTDQEVKKVIQFIKSLNP